MFFVPNMIDTLYYDYININGPVFFDTEASGEIAFRLSDIYLGRDGGRANNGMFADAYTNLGMIGVLIFPILICILIRILDTATTNLHTSIIVFSAVIVATTLDGSFLTRSMLTHGLLILIVVLSGMPRIQTSIEPIMHTRTRKGSN